MSEAEPLPNVISIAGLLERKHKPRECQHEHVEIDTTNRKLECLDCRREVDAFTVICNLADAGSEWKRRWEAMRRDYQQLAGYVPHLRAVRTLESMWRGNRLPMCPHCKKGVTAEALNKLGWVHAGYAEAVSKHERETVPTRGSVTTLHPEPAA